MSLFVDTSVWSHLLRRDVLSLAPEARALAHAIESGEALFTTGLVLQEILQGFNGPRARDQILAAFASLPLIIPDREDHVRAADLRNRCRRAGVQVGTIDVLLAQLCIRHDLMLLTADADFSHIARRCPLRIWNR